MRQAEHAILSSAWCSNWAAQHDAERCVLPGQAGRAFGRPLKRLHHSPVDEEEEVGLCWPCLLEILSPAVCSISLAPDTGSGGVNGGVNRLLDTAMELLSGCQQALRAGSQGLQAAACLLEEDLVYHTHQVHRSQMPVHLRG